MELEKTKEFISKLISHTLRTTESKIDNKIDLKITGIRKSFGKKEVLKGISFTINKGDRYAIVGANGSGKSTLINIITGLITNYRGKVSYIGFKNRADFLHKVGVQFQENNWPNSFKVDDLVRLTMEMNFDSTKHEDKKIWWENEAVPWKNELLDIFNLSEHKNKKIKNLSGGQKQLVNILLAFAAKPRFLILDEITTGLDVRMQERVLRFIRKYVDENNTTLIIVSHITNEIDNLVEKIIIMEDGKFKKPLTLQSIHKKYGTTQAYMSWYFGGDK